VLKSAGISLAPVEAEENINNAVVKTDEPVTAPALISYSLHYNSKYQ
jgi:hypothetical protein